MPELLLEILSEEIPARMQFRATADLKRLITEGLKGAGLEFEDIVTHVTPRRLAVVVKGLPEKQPDVSEEKRGPKVGAPEQAVNGFKGSLPDGAVIEERETPKGTFYFATVEKKGEATAFVLPDVLGKALGDLSWPKSMRWASKPERWVRPIHSIICLLDDEVIPASFAGVTAGATTVGHRFMAPEPFAVRSVSEYRQKLLDAKVRLDPEERSAKIGTDAHALAKKAGVTVKHDPGLLDEVAGLVEWPVVLMGTIDDQFMDLPPEVLTTSMRSHQKYFATLDSDGKLANKFVVVANTETKDGGQQVVAGNERVLRARLSDAKFFWDQDRAVKLEDRVEALKDRVFHAKLGSVLEKVDRIESLAAEISKHVDGAEETAVRRAARLAKADLSTGMVGEFPELQGLMGQYYAAGDGEDAAVADAVREHYSPLGPGDECPSAPVSVCVALADKIDSLVGFFAIDEKPTGSKDPYALRRAALGVIRLVLENKLRLSLERLFLHSQQTYAHSPVARRAPDGPGASFLPKDEWITRKSQFDLMAFFADRLKVHLKERGTRHDLIDAVFSLGGEDDLVRLMKRVEALQEFLKTEDGENLLAAYKRAANILKIEEKKDGVAYTDAADASLFAQGEEHVLSDGLGKVGPDVATAVAEERFQDAMQAIAGLRAPVDAFFDEVTVNADDPALRVNRLKLLNGIRSALDGVADFSKIEG